MVPSAGRAVGQLHVRVPQPGAQGVNESQEDFPGVAPAPPGLCSPEPRQLPKMLSAGHMVTPGGEKGERFMLGGS